MPSKTSAAALLLSLTLAGCASAPKPYLPPAPATAPPPAAAEPAAAAAPAPTTPAELLPGIPLDSLSASQQALVAAWAKETYCYCGCPHTVAEDLRSHASCPHAPRMARLAVRLAGAGIAAGDLGRLVTAYYANFDAGKRNMLDVGHFGPPLGEPASPITIVEFSDYTCPYCQIFRPQLEKFVQDRPGRVKLIYKPFPIESHQNALVAAQAGEWGRDKGIFWKLQEKLFTSPQASPAEMAGWARDLGQDGADLEEALTSERLLPKVRASQVEARAAGLRGTPTLYLNGRRLTVPDLSEWMLEFTLQDEETWRLHGGWRCEPEAAP